MWRWQQASSARNSAVDANKSRHRAIILNTKRLKKAVFLFPEHQFPHYQANNWKLLVYLLFETETIDYVRL